MAEKIILFLSELRPNAKEENYECPNGESVRGTQSNEAPVRYLLREHPDISEIVCLLTPEAEGNAWEYFQSAFQSPSLRLTPIPFNMKTDALTDEPLRKILYERLREGDKVYLETTGGTRDVVMFFLLLTRILSYKRISPAGATYSDFQSKTVKDVTHLNKMFDLVGGMQELTSFGSTRTLRQYYGSPAADKRIERLLKSTENLTEAITLCRTGRIDELLGQFNRAIQEAELCDDLLLRQLLPVFRKRFWDGRGMTVPGLIKWCLDSDMLQQALTIYKERMPKYLLSQKSLMEWNKETLSPKEEQERRKRYQSMEEALFSKYFSRAEKEESRKRHQSVEEALFSRYFLELGKGYYSPVRALERFHEIRDSQFLSFHCSTEKLRHIAMDYFYIRALRNMVNHANDQASQTQRKLEKYLSESQNSRGRPYLRMSDVTASSVKRIVDDALENLKPAPGGKAGKRKRGPA